MCKIKFLLIFCIFLFIFSVQLLADENSTASSGSITQIEIIGLRRTREETVLFPLERFLGRDASLLDVNDVQAVIRNVGVVEPVNIELIESDNGFILRLTVAERWSIFPFPLIMAGSGSWTLGLFLADTNAFGLANQLAGGVIYGSSGLSVISVYNHNAGRSRFPGWNIMFMYGNQEVKNTDSSENVYRLYNINSLRISLGLNYPVNDILSVSTSHSFTNIALEDNTNKISPPENGAMLLGNSINLSLRSSNWDGIFLSQRSLSLRYGYTYDFLGSYSHETGLRLVFEHSIIPGFRITSTGNASWRPGTGHSTDIYTESGPPGEILPSGFSASSYAGISLGLEKNLMQFSWGNISVLASWQTVLSYNSITGNDFNHGPSGGIRLFLSRIALPALGAYFAYNMSADLFQMGFSMGMGF